MMWLRRQLIPGPSQTNINNSNLSIKNYKNPFEEDSSSNLFNTDSEIDIGQIRKQQKYAIESMLIFDLNMNIGQESGLNTLLGAVRKQKVMAGDIGNELDDQNCTF